MIKPHWMLELPIELVKEIPHKHYGSNGVEKHYVDVNGDKAVVWVLKSAFGKQIGNINAF